MVTGLAPIVASSAEESRWDRTSWPGACWLIRQDVRRRLFLEDRPTTPLNVLGALLMPGVTSVVAYRLATVLKSRGYRKLDRLVQDLQYLYTGIELHTGSNIGPGLVIADCPGGGIAEGVQIGRNCTILGGVTMTPNNLGSDLLKGLISLGDFCVLGEGVRITGAVNLATGTQARPYAVVLRSSTAVGGVLEGLPARCRRTIPIDAAISWNPLKPWLTSYPADNVEQAQL